MPNHTSGNRQQSSLFKTGTTSKYVISNTDIPYNGKVVNFGGDLYTTQGGCLEYNSQEVKLVKGNENISDTVIQTNLIAKPNQFRNRRTGEIVAAGTIYHIHPETGPMFGGTHSSLPAGTENHDYFDYILTPSNGNGQMMGNGGRIQGPSTILGTGGGNTNGGIVIDTPGANNQQTNQGGGGGGMY
tara:strand:+ start:292 stop:849 length:558 start_codon:yes stop_codon:yes gene_type:complete